MQKKQYVQGVIVGSVAWLGSGALILWNWSKLPPEIPFLYSLPVGQQQLVTKPWLLVIWGGFGLLMWCDAILAGVVARDEELLQKFLVWGGVVTQILLLLTILMVTRIIV